MLRRAFHDNFPESRHNTIIQNNLDHTIRFFLTHYVIPGLRTKDGLGINKIKQIFSDEIIKLYSNFAYNLGAGYIKKLVNDNNTTKVANEKDKEVLNSLNDKYNDQFWSLIDSYNNMQRSENRLGYQIVAGEKERLASELASTICWTSFNQGVKNKGIEYKDQIEKLGEGDELITGIIRDVRTKDFTKKKQLILTTRFNQEDFEKLSARRKKNKSHVPVSMPKFEKFLKSRRKPTKEKPVVIKDIPGLERNLKGLEDFARIVFVLVTQQDEKVCPECRDLELDTWEAGDPDLPDPPVHPNCRCSLRLAESEFLE